MGPRLLAAAAAAAWAVITGCGGSSLDQNSSCRDFLQASQDDQNAAVAKVAEQRNVSDVQSPLVRPNVEFTCGNSPTESLGDAVAHSGTPTSQPDTTSVTPPSSDTTSAPAPTPPQAPSISLKTDDPSGALGVFTYEASFGGGFRLDKQAVKPPFVDVIITLHIKNTTDRPWGGRVPVFSEVPRSLVATPHERCDQGGHVTAPPRAHTRGWCVVPGSMYGSGPSQIGSGETADLSFYFGSFQPNVTQQDIRFYVGGKLLPTE
jgi:hypothetical protein